MPLALIATRVLLFMALVLSSKNIFAQSTCNLPNAAQGVSSISLDESTHTLMGASSTTVFAIPSPFSLFETCSVSATMSGPNVSTSGSNSNCNGTNPGVTLTSTSYLANSQYCVAGTHSFNGSCATSVCLMTPNQPRLSSLEYELILTDDLTIDTNSNTGGGKRIFPDKKIPTETVDRRKIRVKAQYFQPVAGIRVYFRSFDVDDPSADAAPIDTNDTPTVKTGDDNNGTVDGTPPTKAGKLIVPATGQPNPYNCQAFSNGVSCETDSSGIAKVDFIVTQQPGDNFSVVAGPNEPYVSSLVPASDGVNLKDSNNIQTPVSSGTPNPCASASVQACRTEMLTVWRRLHIELDSMGNVGESNLVTGTINTVRQVNNQNCNPLPPPSPPPDPPCHTTTTVYDVTTTDGQPLEVQRFASGRIVIGKESYPVLSNIGGLIEIGGGFGLARKGKEGKSFILYDDDDYNNDDGLKDGDKNETIVQLRDSLRYLSAADGNYPEDGKPRNLYASSYVMPEYNWAISQSYNQTNLQFDLNVENGQDYATIIIKLTQNRGSTDMERDEFWIGYVLFGYQGPKLEDFDGLDPTGMFSERATQGGSPSTVFTGTQISTCDCYMSATCPTGGVSCVLPNGTPVIPRGGLGSIINQEINQDLTRYFLSPPLPLTSRVIEEIKLTIPHEIGHQFGLLGDQKRTTFRIMDYSDYVGGNINDETLHPEHINIIRRRVKSPGN